jgi:hypothetical protein
MCGRSNDFRLESSGRMALLALVSATNGSPRAHVPTPAILCKFKKDRRGSMKKELLKIARLGLAIKHPTRGNVTWQLTRAGVSASSSATIKRKIE